MEFKVSVELIPETSIYDNLRSVVKKSVWDKLRKATYAEYHHSCGKCGSEVKPLDCHEIWEFDDEIKQQKLIGLIAVCRMCHLIIHHGRANTLIQQGILDREALIQHFITVNRCSREEYMEHVNEAFSQWRERSNSKWSVDLGEYAKYVIVA